MPTSDGETHRKTCKRWNLPWHAHELTFSCFHRHAFLTNSRVCQYLADAVTRARQKLAFHVWAYVFMPEHVHLLIWPTKEVYSISGILQAVKQSASRRTLAWIRDNNPSALKDLATGWKERPYQFWQDGGGFDRNIHSPEALTNSLSYIHRNPVKRELVALPEDWPWSSARDWMDLTAGPIPIDKETFLNSMI